MYYNIRHVFKKDNTMIWTLFFIILLLMLLDDVFNSGCGCGCLLLLVVIPLAILLFWFNWIFGAVLMLIAYGVYKFFN